MRHSFQEHRFPSTRIVIAVEILRESGIDAKTALSGTEITERQLADPEYKTSPSNSWSCFQTWPSSTQGPTRA